MPAGRPRIYEALEDMEAPINEYFESTDQPTMTGLCNHLNISKSTLHDYQEREEFSYLVKSARAKVEEAVEKRLLYENAGAGPIFWLKNHAGYVDKTEHNLEGGPLVVNLNKEDAAL